MYSLSSLSSLSGMSFEPLSVELSFNSEDHDNYDIILSILVGLILAFIIYWFMHKRVFRIN